MTRRALLAAAVALFAFATNLPLAGRALAAAMGDYDSHHKWHDANWWFHNNPDWISQHHPEWIRTNTAWRQGGDWDDHHHWHPRTWWLSHDRDWVKRNHPDWH